MTLINERRGLGGGGSCWTNQLTQCWTFPSGPTSLLIDSECSLRSSYIPESVSPAHAHAKHARFHINVMLMCL